MPAWWPSQATTHRHRHKDAAAWEGRRAASPRHCMPLRKKHVRRIVFALLVVGILGPAAMLIRYGLHVRGGAYARAVEQTLVSRLRCDATVLGCRPTGSSTAAADAVHLLWTTADGNLTLNLEDLRAESSAYGWYVTAARGNLSLAGPDPQAALAAINQRLVHVEHPSQLMAINIERLGLALDLGFLNIERDARTFALSNMAVFLVSLFDPQAPKRARRSTLNEADLDLGLLATVRLNATSEKGVFDGLHAAMEDVPLGSIRSMLALPAAKDAESIRGTADVTVDWRWPDADADTAAVAVTAHDLDLSQWTQALPGGPVTGTANLDVRYAKPRQGSPALTLHLKSDGGAISGETLAWLDGLRAGLDAAAGADQIKTAPFDRMDTQFTLVGNRVWYAGERDAWGAIPILTVQLFGVEVPLLRAGVWPFDASGLWPALSEGLGLGTSDTAGRN